MSNSALRSDEQVRFQLRSDLEFVEYALGHEQQCVVKDTLRLQYFLFRPVEKALLKLLRSPLSIFELKQAADQELAPERLKIRELKTFLRRLLHDNLLVPDRTGHAHTLLRQISRENRALRWQSLIGVLSIRFPGVNPQSFLDFWIPAVRWLFHPVFMALTLVGFVAALIAVGLNFNRIIETDFLAQNLANPRTAVAIILALGIVKVLHELGHAFACRSVGRDCHELGVMLLAFFPCLYCNVTDIWMEPNRWKRIMVSVAGIYVEMLIAACCVPLWLLSHDGPVQAFWFAMIMICSVNTLLINGNPLLRYDGYYVLSDWLQIPNLYATSQQALSDLFSSLFAKRQPASRGFGFLELYAMAARIYRIFVVGVILLVVYSFFSGLGLERLGTLVTVLLLAITFIPVWSRNLRMLSSSSFRSSLRFGRGMLAGILILSLIALLLCWPVTIRTHAQGEVQLAGPRIVYAPEGGRITWLVSRDADVNRNQIIGWIENDDLELELQQQNQRVAELKLAVEHQELLLKQGADNSGEFELQKQSLANALKIEQQLSARKERLTIRAAVAGKLIALPQTQIQMIDRFDLSRNSTPISSQNLGCNVHRGEPLAGLYDESAIQVRLEVAEHQVGRIAEGDHARLILAQASPHYIDGIVLSIDIEQESPKNRLDSQPESLDERRIGVVVKLTEQNSNIFVNSKALACIHGRKLPIYRFLWQEFLATLDL